MSDKDNITDQDIDNYLNGKDELTTIYSDSKGLKAPEHLELAVKRMARDEEKETSGKKQKPWLIPLAIAATLLLTFSLIVDTQDSDTLQKDLVAENKTGTTKESTETVQGPIAQTKPEKIQTAPKIAEHKTVQVQEKKITTASKQDDFKLPEELNNLVQQTSAQESNNDSLPSSEVLKGWTEKQWRETIIQLKKSGNDELVRKYLDAYAELYPNKKLELYN